MLAKSCIPLVLCPVFANAINIVLSNDDGWAEKNVRVLHDTLVASGQNVLISAPAVDRSGTGKSSIPFGVGSSKELRLGPTLWTSSCMV